MNARSRRGTIALALLLPTMCGACAGLRPTAGPSPAGRAPAADCERLLAPVPLPGLSEGEDFRKLYARTAAQARLANARLASGRDCVARQRGRYGGGK